MPVKHISDTPARAHGSGLALVFYYESGVGMIQQLYSSDLLKSEEGEGEERDAERREGRREEEIRERERKL